MYDLYIYITNIYMYTYKYIICIYIYIIKQDMRKLDFQSAVPNAHTALRNAKHFRDLAVHTQELLLLSRSCPVMYLSLYIYIYVICVYVCNQCAHVYMCVSVCIYIHTHFRDLAVHSQELLLFSRSCPIMHECVCVCMCVCVCVCVYT